MRLEPVLCVFCEEVTLLQLQEDFLPWVWLLGEVLLGLDEDFLREGWVKLEVLEVYLWGVEFAGVGPGVVVALAHLVED